MNTATTLQAAAAACTALLLTLSLSGCGRRAPESAGQEVSWGAARPITQAPAIAQDPAYAGTQAVGFDRNDYPGDDTMAGLHRTFSFTGFWLNNPPGAASNSWAGKRGVLRTQGWGFLVLFNGRLDADIAKSGKAGTAPAALGQSDAAAAISAAQREGFPAGTIIFLDQEEGGRLLDEQAGYLLAWTEAVAASPFKPGVYASGQPVQEDAKTRIDTVQDIRARVKQKRLHSVAIFAYQDQCPPAPGCTLAVKPLSTAGELDLTAWQYAQSPRRPELTRSCARTYAADGNCYAPGFPSVFLDMDLATSSDPSHGR